MKRTILLITILSITISSCKDFLDAKPDKKLAVPTTLQDMNALLDNSYLNTYAMIAEVASDNFYHFEATWKALASERDRNIYIWENSAADGDTGVWSGRYSVIFTANVVLAAIDDIEPKEFERQEWERIKGSAYFHRAYAMAQLAELFAEPYEIAAAKETLGLPLKQSPDINEPTVRASLEATRQQILADYRQAVQLLPEESSIATRPNKVAAYGALARAYLYMRNYPMAGLYADSALRIKNTLLDYNEIANASIPFARFNSEVVFHSHGASTNLTIARSRVDSLLYDSYHLRDRRKALFFRKSSDNKTYSFQGSYAGSTSFLFNGIAVGELYLMRAESRARAGDTYGAMEDLNTLLRKRYENGYFDDMEATSAQEALDKVLEERRKELLFRGQRWSDLRRLNKEPRYAKTLVRKLGEEEYTLPPGDKRYVFPIPEDVIQRSGIQQNEK